MSSREKEKKLRQQKAKYEDEKATIENFRKVAPKLKPLLRRAGCDLPFFDFLDSYEEEFGRIVTTAIQQFPSLLSIHEVDDSEYLQPDWPKYGVDADKQVFFDIDERFAQYGKNRNSKANIRGSATFFLDDNGGYKSVVLIPRSPKCSFEYKDLKYAFKIASLLHELGHIEDAELRINIDVPEKRFGLVEAEAYANKYALEKLADRCLYQTYRILFDGMVELASSGDYEAEVGRLVLERHSHRQIPNWNEFMDAANGLNSNDAS